MTELKSEKEKMISGEFYYCMDPILVEERNNTRSLIDKYNNELDKDVRDKLLDQMNMKRGKNCLIETPLRVDYGYNVTLGDEVFINFGCILLDCAPITIGSYTLCAPNVQFYAATHPTDPKLRLAGKEYALPITVGRNVWIGGNAIILPGVTIGDHSVIGAGSVVTKNIPRCVVAVGNPAKVIKQLEDPDEIK